MQLAASDNAKDLDGEIAVEAATKACELSRWQNPMVLDTLATAYAELGDFTAAVKWQSKAIELVTDDEERKDYGTRLKLYQNKKPYREKYPTD
jgi:tetratricopeptide (TPR) repeat protein